ncbi:MAG: twin-arginine translocase subunit TatC [Parachlamydiaceae bacterium]|nr:twin-arginine translocase subunit TatC [Parachlamydiaceae bacterium]
MMEEKWTSLGGHLEDLRKTILQSLIIVGIGFLILLIFYQPLIKLLPPQNINSLDQNLLILGPLEGLFFIVKMCFWMSLALTAPFWVWSWLKFILPGMKKNERVILIPFLSLSFFSLILGVFFALKITIPIANQYLSQFNATIGQNAWTLNHYFDYLFFIIAGHVIASELGLLLLVFVHFGLIETKILEEKRRIFYVCIFVLSAILTPPDILTQLFLAIPLIILYEVAILYSKWRCVKFNLT